MKRVKFFVHCPNEHIAKFSEEWHARAFAEMLSGRRPGWLIEMTHVSGVVGQYRHERQSRR